MKKLICSLLLIILSTNSYSQTDILVEERKVRLGIFYSYDTNYSSDQFQLDQYSGYNVDYEIPSFSLGITLEYGITGNIFLGSGVSYSERNLSQTYYCAVCDFISPSQPLEMKLQFIEIPLTAKYYLLRTRFGIYGEAGIVNFFSVNSRIEPENQNYFLGAGIGGGVEYQFMNDYFLQLGTSYNRNISEVFKEADYTYQVLGIKFGIAKQF